MKRFFFYIGLLAVPACVKDTNDINGIAVSFNGRFIDDKTGQPIVNGIIAVKGLKRTGGVWFGSDERRGLGEARTDSRGDFALNFIKWDAAEIFEFTFSNTPGYFVRYFTLEANEVHTTDTVIQFTRETTLDIHFKNSSPFDTNDGLSFYSYSSGREFGYTLTPCTTTLVSGVADPGSYPILGNAEGVKRCPVGADRQYYINYSARKNGIVTTYRDSVFCARDIINIFNLDY